MNDASLFETTVPVLKHYLHTIELLLASLPSESATALEQKIAIHAFTSAEHLNTAIGFTLRTILPLLGREVLDYENELVDRDALIQSANNAATVLDELTLGDFDGASQRVIKHTAGIAKLEQNATVYVTMFALPNFFFHLTTAFAILRAEGVDIGKSDFDGQHKYEKGFHF